MIKFNNEVRYIAGLGLSLFVLWLVLSGHYNLLLLSLGALSVVLVVVLAMRMGVVDAELWPLHLNVKALFGYWCWLFREIVIANLYVCRLILSPKMGLYPQVFALRNSQQTDLARVIFANSITLTPGTVALDVDGDITEVHAITGQSAVALLDGSMDARISMLEARMRCSR